LATTFFLVRHASHGLLGHVLTGRMPCIHLAGEGRVQARSLARHFASLGIHAVQTSPRERAEETAHPIAEQAAVECGCAKALDEIEFGAWTGRPFDELRDDPQWQAWNVCRSLARPPGGETMAEVQQRVMDHLRRVQSEFPDGRLVLVSHGDVIKAALLRILDVTVDAVSTFEIAPASVSTVVMGRRNAKVVSVNEQVAP